MGTVKQFSRYHPQLDSGTNITEWFVITNVMANIIPNFNELPPQNKKVYQLVLDSTNGNIAAFAREIGVSQQSFQRIFKIDSRTNKYPSISNQIKEAIFKKFNLDEVWLVSESTIPQNIFINTAHIIENSNFMNVPIIHVRAQCGYLNGYGDQEYIDTLPTLPIIVDQTYHGKYRIFEAEGDSMDDDSRLAICDGDKVLAREVRRELWLPKLHINDWYFVIVHRTRGVSIKQITDQDENGNITCHSLNDLFNDYTINLDDVVEIYNVIKVVERSLRL